LDLLLVANRTCRIAVQGKPALGGTGFSLREVSAQENQNRTG
jgi:hypothetical protein